MINDSAGVVYPEAVVPHIIPFSDLKVQSMPVMELGNYFEDTRALI